MASIWETVSFVARTISTRHQQNVGIELVSDLFVLLAPLCQSSLVLLALLNRRADRNLRGQRIRLHAPRPHDTLLPPNPLHLLHPRFRPSNRLRNPRLHLFRYPNHWRKLRGSHSLNESTAQRCPYLHGRHRAPTILHLYLSWSGSEVSYGDDVVGTDGECEG